MPLSVGEKLGPCEVRTPIGAGGMGEVYRAQRLRRDVAIKVSVERFSERFEKEAWAIASLNHPNVCTRHDLGPNYLVMELVEDQTLADRIKQGAIPLNEAFEPAHETGITYRDLKPGNFLTTWNYPLVTRSFAEAYGIEKSAISQRFDGDRWCRAGT